MESDIRNDFKRLKSQADRVPVPEDCEENDRAIGFLEREMGVGHFDSLNLLVLSALLIFVAAAFLAVSSGKVDDNDKVGLSAKTFLSGEYTRALTDNYNEQLPIPETMKKIEEKLSVFYGLGNSFGEPEKNGKLPSGYEVSPFESDEDDEGGIGNSGKHENTLKVTTVITDENGETVTTEEEVTAKNGGTTALTRPPETSSTTTAFNMYTTTKSETTTNNNAPSITTTTTTMATRATKPTETEPTDTEPTDTEPTESTEPTDTEPTDLTDPPDTSGPEE